jgi:hypothetical protein
MSARDMHNSIYMNTISPERNQGEFTSSLLQINQKKFHVPPLPSKYKSAETHTHTHTYTHIYIYIFTGSTAPLGPGLWFSVLWLFLQTVGLLGRVISSSQGLYLNRGQYKHRINTYTYQTSMPCVRLEPTIPASELAKTVYALDRSATVTGI